MFTVARRMRNPELVRENQTHFLAFWHKSFVLNSQYLSPFRVVLQQNERFSEIEEKYSFLHGKTSNLFNMEEEVLKVSKKVGLLNFKGSVRQIYVV